MIWGPSSSARSTRREQLPRGIISRPQAGGIVTRISYGPVRNAGVVRQFVDFWPTAPRRLDLKLGDLRQSTLIELTAFGTAVMMTIAIPTPSTAPTRKTIHENHRPHSKDALDPARRSILDQLGRGPHRQWPHDQAVAVDAAVQPLIDELTKDSRSSCSIWPSLAGAKRRGSSRNVRHCSTCSISATPGPVRRADRAGDKTSPRKCSHSRHPQRQVRDDVPRTSDWVGDIKFPLLVKPPQEDASLGSPRSR